MKFFISVLISSLLTVACNKSTEIVKSTEIKSLEEDKGCIERIVISVTEHSINSLDVPVINNLFSANGIDKSKFRYSSYLHDSVQTYYPPYTKFDNKAIKVDQYTNGLIIFTGEMVFAFKNDTFNYKGGHSTAGTHFNTEPSLTLGQLRKLFSDDNINQFASNASQYNDSCFKAEFGYYNLNVGIGNSTENLVKAWKVTLKNRVSPLAYYQDSDGKLIYYDSGIRTFR